ncbi:MULTISPECIES: SAM-dependent methyltransferase [unclassified Paenibacillus]|uniref:SAM-dependent methyltransferase n=1 Tax=unclassified Paenibacillus TaxID=185978 RepID=UPI000953C52A|nr:MULTISPECIES: SAM-dependent methyltransferase [unclassified Paenibacillus]SIQ41306.1 23S rRNA (cytidine2498-2'-O)-methyltransferase [Paenibacillus sp. RU4X]SIQ63509.1 23S rRNA (cytidine2498-2'-O)-methyltransferase [Paenibacillus sp. RU4T]
MSQWIGTANKSYASYAMEELRRQFEGISITQLSPGEAFLFEVPLEQEAVLASIKAEQPIFLRHLQPVDAVRSISADADDLDWLSDWIRLSRGKLEGKRAGVHVRKAEGSPYPYSAADTKAVAAAMLEQCGAEPEQKHTEILVAVYASRDTLYAGIGTPAEMLSDWPGGAVRFQKEEGQISRAKFKLLEAEREFGLDYASFRNAVDIGAAPGGWTSLLLERGLRVTAIDPAELHPSLLAYRTLTVLRKNAAEVSFQPGAFDLLVCDMSWSPMQMTKLVLDLVPALQQGGTAIVTVKLMHRKPLQTIREVKSRLSAAFDILGARQLFHNREEMTLYLKKK